MINTLIGQKIDQSQSFLENGNRIPVTEISVLENVVLQVKTAEKDKYSAVQLGSGSKKKPNKAILGQAKKAHSAGSGQAGLVVAPLKIKEIKVDSSEELKTGEIIKVDSVFKPGDIVQVTGTSKGKGFAGVVKRHGFSGGPKTHGQSDRHRAPGSIGQGTTPGRVYKGKRMAGRMGSDTVTVKNLLVVDVDAENKKLYVSGLVPGHRNSWIYITKTGENKKFVPLVGTEGTKETQPSLEATAGKADETASNAADAKVEAAPVEEKVAEAKIEEVKADIKVEDAKEESKEEVKVEAVAEEIKPKEEKKDA